MSVKARELEDRVRPLLEGLGFELLEIKIVPRRSRVVIRIYLDSETEDPAQGITHSDCALVTREVSDYLEGEGLVTGNYVLEVSSPGIGRPLTEARHFRRNLGRLVEVQGRDHEGRSYALVGRLTEAEEWRITLEPPGGSGREIELAEIVNARVVPEFRRSRQRKV